MLFHMHILGKGVALNLTWVLPSKTPAERSLRGYKNPSKGLRCNSWSRMLGK